MFNEIVANIGPQLLQITKNVILGGVATFGAITALNGFRESFNFKATAGMTMMIVVFAVTLII